MARKHPSRSISLPPPNSSACSPTKMPVAPISLAAAGRKASIARAAARKSHKLRPSVALAVLQVRPETSYRFSHIAGTIFENTNKPLRDWFGSRISC